MPAKLSKKKIIHHSPSVKMSAKKIQDLRTLAILLNQIIPSTSFPARSFCFRKIAEDNQFKKYWTKQKDINAPDAIYFFLKNVYKKHKKTLYRILREALPLGIERRIKAGKPVLEDEIQKISEVLLRLEINLTSELRSLNLPKEMPSIIPPVPYLKEIPAKIGLHPFLLPDCLNLYNEGHFNESVRKSLEKYEVYIQKKSGSDKQGNDLMSDVFNQDVPKIEIFDIANKRGKGLQDGFKLLSMGMMGFWRNYLSHGDEKQIPAKHALSILLLVSHTLYVVDGDILNENNSSSTIS
jgi:uncharacterized protein (TIGR02391 family)